MPPSRRGRAIGVACALALAVATLAGCVGGESPHQSDFSGPAYTLRTLSSSELADMKPILDDAAKTTGVTVALTPATSLSAARRVTGPGGVGGKYDAVWLASDRYVRMFPGGFAKLNGTTEIASSPVVVGVRASVARRLGWDRNPVSWADIAAAAAAGEFTFGMSDPSGSNSGLSALVGVATAVAGNGAALEDDEIGTASPELRALFGGQTLKTNDTQDLLDAYVRAQGGDAQGGPVDGLIDYESELMSLNASGRLTEPLTLVYPSNGVVTAEYSFDLLASAPPAAKDAYRRLTAYLRTPDVQQRIMRVTRRRPIIPDVAPDAGFGRHQMFELPFPDSITVIDDLIAAYDGTLRRPARTVYVLDTSGSMRDDNRLAGLKAGMAALTDGGGATAIQTREQVTLLPFNTAPGRPSVFDVPADDPQPVLARINDAVGGLVAGGNTDIYDSLAAAYQLIGQQAAADPNRVTTIVLLTDGANNTGRTPAQFADFYHALPPAVASVPVFPILFGAADDTQMRALAGLTGGQVFDGRNLPLTTVLPLIRGDQ